MLLKNQIKKLKKGKSLLALSGGVDSVVLFDLLIQNKIPFEAAHVNYKLRGEDSELDQKFVEELCKKHNIVLHLSVCNTKNFAKTQKTSIQIAARDFRYSFFKELQKQYSIENLLSAHHLEDQLETFLINLSRGTGIKGLRGIDDSEIIRPLLEKPKEEIYAYAKTKKLEWREDKSNAESKYLRNFIRNVLIKKWKKKSPNLLTGFLKTIEFLDNDYQILQDLHQKKFEEMVLNREKDILVLDLDSIKKEKNNDYQLYWWFSPFGFKYPKEIAKLLKAEKGKEIQSESHRLIVGKNEWILVKIQAKKSEEEVLVVEKPKHFKKLGLQWSLDKKMDEKALASFDFEKLHFPLTFRNTKQEDKFSPFGMVGQKKVSKFLKDLGKNKLEKENQMVLEDANGKIVWVVAERIDNSVAVAENSTKILNLYP